MPHDETSGSGPHDVTMPQLGMAQDAGRIVSWLKAPGERVAKGDALFEVETDKAVMEVEATADGYLTGVAAKAGEDVPVGQVIARITDSAEGDGGDGDAAAAEPPAEPGAEPGAGTADALPEGHPVTMPQLGMAQDTGLLVGWHRQPGDRVAAEDVLFEVETDKSTMEVAAGRDGWLAATLALAGEEVPTGQPVAIIADEKPDAPVARAVKDGKAAPAPAEAEAPAEAAPAPGPARKPAAAAKASPAASGGRILASPKARRLAMEQGLDLARLAEAGHPQPYHAADLDVLRALPAAAPAQAMEAPRRLTAACAADGFADFAAWAAGNRGLKDADAILAGLAGASLGAEGGVTVAVERFGASRAFAVPPGRHLAGVTATDDAPALILRDLRATPLTAVAMGAEAAPVLTVTRDGAGLSITLECAATALDAGAAIRLLTEFAGRMEQPLRHLL
ncbi:pyruvate dehydrogenase [Halovulum dunhuangense]|uniref:Pyruvate dehydrogenase n=1 Tax=Halovulum dunhuangense TaxID=1505036 RepID=A0A849L8A6_9RHOB|nr:biotin/lipoyl-containing protein [Halovulum dunhuangense]NNU82241.1 pyruvate dehydrogenase [Halovulum dunhuangense]